MPKLLIFDAFTLLIREKTVANYALLRCKTFSLKIWVCKIFDKFHVCRQARLNTWIELKFWVDRIIVIVSDLDLGNPQHDAPGLDIAFSSGSTKEKDQDTHT